MTAWGLLKDLNSVCHFMSRERNGKASNSEMKRWCQNKAVSINGVRVNFDDELKFPIKEMYLFPKNRVTLF